MIPGTLNTAIMGRGTQLIAEDFTTFTEVDPNDRISLATSSATFTALNRSEITYAYKDYAATPFDENFTIDFDFQITTSNTSSFVDCVTLTNTLADAGSMTNYLKVGYFQNGATPQLRIVEDVGGNIVLDVYNMPNLNRLYCRFSRNEVGGGFGLGTGNLFIATSEANRDAEIWVDILGRSLNAFQDFRYMQICTSINSGTSAPVTGDISNLSYAFELI